MPQDVRKRIRYHGPGLRKKSKPTLTTEQKAAIGRPVPSHAPTLSKKQREDILRNFVPRIPGK